MSDEEASVKLTGDTRHLDNEVEKSARKQVQLAERTASEIQQINNALDQKMLRDFDRIGARGNAAIEAGGRSVVKMKEDVKVFGSVALRVGAGASTAIFAVATAAKAVNDELDRSRKLLAGLSKTGSDQTIDTVNSLTRLGLKDVGGVVDAARKAQGPVRQSEMDSFLGKLGESGLSMDSDRAKDLVRVYANNAPVLGDGSSLLAAQKLFPMRTADAAADAAVSYRQRTGSDLSLSELRDKDKQILDAEEKSRLAGERVMQARTGGNIGALRSAEEAAFQARDQVEQLKAQRSDFSTFAQPENGAAARAKLAGGAGFLNALIARTAERRNEVDANNKAGSYQATRAYTEELQREMRDRQRATDSVGSGVSAFKNAVRPWIEPVLNGAEHLVTSSTPQARAAAGTLDRIAGELATQTLLIQQANRPEFRPDSQSE